MITTSKGFAASTVNYIDKPSFSVYTSFRYTKEGDRWFPKLGIHKIKKKIGRKEKGPGVRLNRSEELQKIDIVRKVATAARLPLGLECQLVPQVSQSPRQS